MKSKGPKQRVHFAKVVDGDVLVADSSEVDVAPGTTTCAVGKSFIASDTYAFAAFNAGAKDEAATGGGGKGAGEGGGNSSASSPRVPLHSSISNDAKR